MMSVDSARERHGNRQPYAALLGSAEKPRFVVDVAGQWVSVAFLDSRQRKYLNYSFKEVEPGRLFLKGADFWDYEGDSELAKSKKIFNSNEDGHIVVAEQIGASDDVREFEITDSVEENWDSYPQFGEYYSLCREQRVT